MAVTVQILTALGVPPSKAALFVDPLNAAMALSAISTPQRQAAFLGQILVESDYFNHLEENLYYSNPARVLQIFPSSVKTLAKASTLIKNPVALGNCVYANRGGNGSEASGDGYRYRGRGLIGLTFKSGYARAQEGTGRPYLSQPDLLSTPTDACLSAAWYWVSNGCNIMADAGKVDLITRTVNGPGMLQKDTRLALYQKALTLLPS